MEIIHCCLKEAYETQVAKGSYGGDQLKTEGFLHFSTWNSFRLVAPAFFSDEREYILLVVDTYRVRVKWEKDDIGHTYPHVYQTICEKDIKAIYPFQHDGKTWISKPSTHVLMNTSMIDEAWCYPVLKHHIQPSDEVCVLAFSFFDDTKTMDDWNRQYKPGQGIWYKSNTDVFFRYGLKREQIHWINYFEDTKKEMENKIMNSSILLLTGGAPDLMMKRIREFKLTPYLKHYHGLMIGYSAGAMVQLDQYHITPDEDYPSFVYESGFGALKGFAIEPHYHQTKLQQESIERVLAEKKKPVYAIYENGGMLIKEDHMELFGQVDVFDIP